MMLRILASLLLLFFVLFMPLWVSILLALAGVIYFNVFWEAPILFLLSDLLYGVKEARLFDITFISMILALIFLIGAEFLKKKTNFTLYR